MKNDNVFEVILLLALPASGKSEVRNFLSNIEPEVLKREFHIGETLQLDDFPYVHFMKQIDKALEDEGHRRMFYPGEEPFLDSRDWGTLINLLNEDYYDLVNRNYIECNSVAEYFFTRIDKAARIAGIDPRLGKLDGDLRKRIAEKLNVEAQKILDFKYRQYVEDLKGKTIVIEAARGGKDGSTLPLQGAFGYQYSLRQFCPELLSRARILYIWVTPEESRRKNEERTDPNDPGSNLFHGVPISVMINDYGCDDMLYLKENSEVADTITVKAHGETYHIPIGIFDNRNDRTSFLRKDKAEWTKEEIDYVTKGIRQATDKMIAHGK
ncbi:MAG TPA: hypothetical protein PK631_05095 [Erysipelotrichaceae bacterium]|nr:hypothetical protein [Erysipelotrichaceae bacterium]